ncbi:MAG: hypothetical protein K2V38_00310, partial [Gemmataceae bacterium]|nr:hypothetical protein [Gemmataceae bacterium]
LLTITGTPGDGVNICDVKAGSKLMTLKDESLTRTPYTTHTAIWSPNGTRILTADGDGACRVWDSKTGALTVTLNPLRSLDSVSVASIYAAVWSPNGEQIATASADGIARVWEAKTGRELLACKGHSGVIEKVTWRPDGKRIATLGRDGTARVWDATTGAETSALNDFTDNTGWLTAWSPNGEKILDRSRILSNNGKWQSFLYIYDIRSRRSVACAASESGVRAAGWSSDGQRVWAICDDALGREWDAESGSVVRGVALPGGLVSGEDNRFWSTDGGKVVTLKGSTFTLRDSITGNALAPVSSPALEQLVHNEFLWTRDSATLVAAGHSGSGEAMRGHLLLWSAKSGVFTPIGAHVKRVGRVAFSPDEARLAYNCSDGTTRVWNLKAGREEWCLQNPGVSELAWDSTGARLATVA